MGRCHGSRQEQVFHGANGSCGQEDHASIHIWVAPRRSAQQHDAPPAGKATREGRVVQKGVVAVQTNLLRMERNVKINTPANNPMLAGSGTVPKGVMVGPQPGHSCKVIPSDTRAPAFVPVASAYWTLMELARLPNKSGSEVA